MRGLAWIYYKGGWMLSTVVGGKLEKMRLISG